MCVECSSDGERVGNSIASAQRDLSKLLYLTVWREGKNRKRKEMKCTDLRKRRDRTHDVTVGAKVWGGGINKNALYRRLPDICWESLLLWKRQAFNNCSITSHLVITVNVIKRQKRKEGVAAI